MEKWDVYTAEGEPTGRTVVRGTGTLKSGEYHLVVHVWPYNDYGSLLIQKRTKTRRMMPNIWAATGGAAIAGETSLEAAKRELYEELGILAQEGQLQPVKRLKRRNSLLDIWAIHTDAYVPEMTLQKSEVAKAKWVSFSTLNSMIKSGEYHDYGKEYFAQIHRLVADIKVKKAKEDSVGISN